jgi:hypothetical protein
MALPSVGLHGFALFRRLKPLTGIEHDRAVIRRGLCQLSFGRGQTSNAYLFTALPLNLCYVAIVG